MAKVHVDVTRHLKIVEKIPFVRGLAISQMQKVLHAGHLETFTDGQVLCKAGENSTSMFILLSGTLAVQSGDVELAKITPVDIVGEMGVVTNQPRCATLVASGSATVITVPKMQFDALLKTDVDMAARIYKNMLDSLSQKLRVNNDKLTGRSDEDNRLLAASV